MPGLDFGDLGLSSGVVIPHKFKAPTFAKYDGASCPKLHLWSYVRKIQPYTADKNLWIHFVIGGSRTDCLTLVREDVAEARVATVFYFLQLERTKAQKNSL